MPLPLQQMWYSLPDYNGQWWEQSRQFPLTSAPFSVISWTGITNLVITWVEDNNVVKRYAIPVQNDVSQTLNYTFKDQSNNIINLSTYVSVVLEIKRQGVIFTTQNATFISLGTNGQVQCTPVLPDGVGVWNFQFVCIDGSGNKLYGEILQVIVIHNVSDLALTQLP